MRTRMTPSFAVRCADAVFLSRPLLWIPVWGFFGFGYFSGMVSMHGFSLTAAWGSSAAVAAWMLVFSCSVGAVYVVNQIADKEVDALNAGFPLLAIGKIPAEIAWGSATVLAVVSVAVPLSREPVISFFSGMSLAVGLLYCAKPFYFSRRAVLDFLSNATGYAFIAFGAGWHLSGAVFGVHFFIAALPYFFLMCGGSISSTIPDVEGDKKCGKRTTAVITSIKTAHWIATFFIIAGLVAAWVLRDWIAVVCAGLALPLYCAYMVRPNAGTMESTYKIGGMVMMLEAAVLFPWMFPASLVSLAATIAYFRLRYHVWYPSLVPGDPKQ
jgi:4-hydroxybenzoate polyprenyltransferase